MKIEKLSEYAAERIAEIAVDASMSGREKVNRILAVVEMDTQTKIIKSVEISQIN